MSRTTLLLKNSFLFIFVYIHPEIRKPSYKQVMVSITFPTSLGFDYSGLCMINNETLDLDVILMSCYYL
jgi:hypothetical protein